MRRIEKIFIGLLIMVFMGISTAIQAQTVNNQKMMMNSQKMQKLVTRLETQTDWFKDNLADALDNNRVNETDAEDNAMAYVKAFEVATDNVRDRVEDNELTTPDVEALLTRALMIEEIMTKLPSSATAKSDWMMVKNTLDQIAKSNNVSWVWVLTSNPYWKTARVEPIFDRLENNTDSFANSLKYALDYSKFNGTEVEDQAIKYVDMFEKNTDELERKSDSAAIMTAADLNPLLKQGMVIESFLRTNSISPRVWSDWIQVRASLRELAMRNNVTWSWSITPVSTNSMN